MKVRNDFVSNSSSCSFVIAINKQYDISSFAKDLAKACSNPNDTYHYKDTVKRNQRILDFCLNTYELTFLGTWKLRTDKHVYSRKDMDDLFLSGLDEANTDDHASENETLKTQLLQQAEDHWNYELDCIKKAKDPKCDPYFKKLVDRNYIDQNEKLHIFDDVYVGGCAVDSDCMRYAFNRYGYDGDEAEDVIKQRVKDLKKFAENSADCENGKTVGWSHVRCYAITMNTVKNTRNLLDAGCDLTFDNNVDLDGIEKRLKSGEQIFVVHIGHDGEGYGNFEIYCEDNANGLDDVAAEILYSEPM